MGDGLFYISVLADYGELNSSKVGNRYIGGYGKLEVIARTVNRALEDFTSMGIDANCYVPLLENNNLKVRMSYGIKSSEVYDGIDIKAEWEQKHHSIKAFGEEHIELRGFMRIFGKLLIPRQTDDNVWVEFAPDVYIMCPNECQDFVENGMNYFGKTLDPNQAETVPPELFLRASFKLNDGVYTRTPKVNNEYVPVMELKKST